MYSKCMIPKPKAYSSKKYKKFHGIDAQKLSCIDQKYEKQKPNEKLSINVITLVRGNISSFLLVRKVT